MTQALQAQIALAQSELDALDSKSWHEHYDATQWMQRKQEMMRRLQERIAGLTHKLRVSKPSEVYYPGHRKSNSGMARVIQEMQDLPQKDIQSEDDEQWHEEEDKDEDEEEEEEDKDEENDKVEDLDLFARRTKRLSSRSTRSSYSMLSLPDSCSLVENVSEDMQRLIDSIQESNDGIDLLEKKIRKYKKYMKKKKLPKREFLSCGKKIKELEKTLAHEGKVLQRLEDDFYSSIE